MSFSRTVISVAVLIGLLASAASASIVIDTVPVGNPGNAGELSGGSVPGGFGSDRICGAVDYTYNIGKYEVTAGQYTAFLSAVAATDPYGLYSTYMWTSDYGCKIERSGSSGSYTYSVAGDWANRPVNFVSWGDAARFVNWLHNGQPIGEQDLSTTEDGSYLLNGAVWSSELLSVVRKPNATWVIPTEDEWYKAAYHLNDGASGNYWDYPTGSDSPPGNDIIDPAPGNNANIRGQDGSFVVGPPYWRTEVGVFRNSASPYGTYDQAGNVCEWNETIVAIGEGPELSLYAGNRGGWWYDGAGALLGGIRMLSDFGRGDAWIESGFRVSEVPEPTSLALLALGGIVLARRRGLRR